MKTLVLFFALFAISSNAKSQERKVEIVADSLFHLPVASGNKIVRWSCSYTVCGIEVEYVSSDYFLPFKLFEFSNRNENWFDTQSIYNTISAKVPGVSINTGYSINQAPLISMRGDDNTIVIVDGIRYDVSIFNTLNPADIESISVSNSVAAQNYFINN